MYLICDIGNTETKICIFDSKKKLKKKINLKTKLITKKLLNNKLSFSVIPKKKIQKAIFCSVVPNCYKIFNSFIKKKFKIKPIELKELDLSQIIKIKVNKKQVGSDRISNAISVIDNKSNFIVVDFGTATTFDVIIKNMYLGGVIAPGVNLSLNTLIGKASLIPPIKLTSINKVLGKNTIEAVRSGFYWGYVGLIENIIKKIFKQTKKKYKIVFTGGLSILFKRSIGRKIYFNSDLTINGLLKIIQLIK